MRYDRLDKSVFEKNRKRFMDKMSPNSLAVFFSNDLMPKSADQFFTFRQNSDLFYLSGIDQEETMLILYPDAPDPKFREVLFLRETNAYIAIWEGDKLTQEDGSTYSGVENVKWNNSFQQTFDMLMKTAESCYFNLNEHDRYEGEVPYLALRKAREIKEEYPGHNYLRSTPILKDLRAIKSQEEIDIMQKACDITHGAFEQAMRFSKPGVMEYEIEAEVTREFMRKGGEGHAYTPIVASGANACVLHYITNHMECKDGDMILFDFGCSYGNYAADLSRTIPVNGRFTDRQKQVYNAVLRTFKAAKKKLVPGTILADYQEEVGRMIEKELVDLGVLSMTDVKKQDPKNPLYKKYFPHGTSHHIGLDVHDIPFRHKPLEAGMVFTCEPGIYIRKEGIGVRLENDMVVQEKGEPFDLMRNIPIETDEIEDFMNS